MSPNDVLRLEVVGLVPPNGDESARSLDRVHDGGSVRARHGVDEDDGLLALGQDRLDLGDFDLRRSLRVNDLNRDTQLLAEHLAALDVRGKVGVCCVDYGTDEDEVFCAEWFCCGLIAGS